VFLTFIIHGIYGQENLRLLSWNIQHFGYHKTELQIEQIASVIEEYDIVAIQQIDSKELSAEKAISQLIIALNAKGFDWSYTLSQPTKTKKSNQQRYAFLWKTYKVKVLGNGFLLNDLQRKVVHEPFVMNIKWNNERVSLYNYQAKPYQENPEKEIQIVLDYLLDKQTPTILMGNFNTTQNREVFKQRRLKNAITNNQKTLLKNKCYYHNHLHLSVDNIFYTTPYFTLLSSGVLDYVGECENLKLAHRISNHLPVVAFLQPKTRSYEVSLTTSLKPSP
jgi:endonuclease/exonuclease/phosphatase family metal-dependent hydrolase